MKKIILAAVIMVLPVFYYACGGSGGGDYYAGTTGTVPLYVTDGMGNFQQVTMTLNDVRLVHTGTGTSCDLLSEPASLDIANLAGVLQLLDSSECPVQPYNRVHLEFDKNVDLMDQDGVIGSCLFESYKDHINPNQPNVLICENSVCTIDINGGINVIAGTTNPFALDFDLKNFEVENFGPPDCRVTLKVEPQNDNDINEKVRGGYQKSVTGYVADLDIDADTFTLTTKKGTVLPIDYSQALYRNDPQPDIDILLQFAADNHLRVRVLASSIDVLGGEPVIAETIYVKLDGLVSGLDEVSHLFTLTNSVRGITIVVDYTNAAAYSKVEGNLGDDSWVETKLYGLDVDNFLAHEVEVEAMDANDTDD